MTADRAGLLDHLATGVTTVCRCWSVTRGDGVVIGFTDHDRDLGFDGVTFRAATGMTAQAFQQVTGLAVDNSEAVGALTSAAIDEADLAAGRFDGAEVRCWQVNWAAPDERILLFRGHFGEVTRAGGSFRVELRGLTDALNQPQGRVYQAGCSAVPGDARCGFDLSQAGYTAEGVLTGSDDLGGLVIGGLPELAEGWFERGYLTTLEGPGQGRAAMIRRDDPVAGGRRIELWEPLATLPVPGERLKLVAGCDRTAATCRAKFANFANFRGFPHVPGEDWLTAYPAPGRTHDGGSRSG